jgi:NADH-quinone oxidoreductase subunit L
MSDSIRLTLIAVFSPLAALFVIAVFTRTSRVASAAVSTASILVSLGCSLLLLAGSGHRGIAPVTESITWLTTDAFTLRFGILLDSLSAGMIFVVCVVSALVHIYSLSYMAGDKGLVRYYAWLSLFSWAMLFFVVSPTLLQAFFGWELVGAASFLLIGFWYVKPEAAQASRKAFVMTRFGDFGFMVAVILLLTTLGNVEFESLNRIANGPAMSPGFVTLCALLLFMGVMGKSAQFPLHTWLPDAMEGPTPVSALIHAATMVAAGIYLIARMYGFFSASALAMEVMAAVGITTALVGASIALVQDDVKKVMAYSTISQLGIMVCALGCGAYRPGVFHLFTHAFFKALLFLCAGSLIHHFGTNDMWEMAKKGGAKSMPVTGPTLIAGALALAGVVPFAGFFSKDAIVGALEMSSHGIYANLILLVGFVTAYYTFRMVFVLFVPAAGGTAKTGAVSHGPKEDHGPDSPDIHDSHHGSDSPAPMTVPLLILAFFSVSAGFLDTPLLKGIFTTFLTMGAEEGESLHLAVMVKSTGVALFGIALAYLHFGRRRAARRGFLSRAPVLERIIANKYYLDDLYGLIVRGGLYPFAAVLNWIDRKVINDTGINGSGNLVVIAGRRISRQMNGLFQRYIVLTVFAVLAVIVYIWQQV